MDCTLASSHSFPLRVTEKHASKRPLANWTCAILCLRLSERSPLPPQYILSSEGHQQLPETRDKNNFTKMLTLIDRDLKEKNITVTFWEGTLKSTFYTLIPSLFYFKKKKVFWPSVSQQPMRLAGQFKGEETKVERRQVSCSRLQGKQESGRALECHRVRKPQFGTFPQPHVVFVCCRFTEDVTTHSPLSGKGLYEY